MNAVAKTPLVRQTIDQRTTTGAGGTVVQWETLRDTVLAGPVQGVSTFTTLDDAVRAASTLSSTHNPGMAILKWRGGYRLHDVRSDSHTYRSTTSHGPLPPLTIEVDSSNVPFAIGNVRAGGNGATPPLVYDERLVALVDGTKWLRVEGSDSDTGAGQLVEHTA